MKKIYILPQTTIVNLELEGRLLDGSVEIFGSSTKEIDEANAGLVKGNDRNSRGNYNVWDDDWSK